jgi:hypothetical protein
MKWLTTRGLPVSSRASPVKETSRRLRVSLAARWRSRYSSPMAQQRSNSRPAFISERTVESHVPNIFNKLGVDSRVQPARWVASIEVPVEAGALTVAFCE